jgi:hypothetical protein
MPRVGFEHTIPVFQRAKSAYALDRAATVIGRKFLYNIKCIMLLLLLLLSSLKLSFIVKLL